MPKIFTLAGRSGREKSHIAIATQEKITLPKLFRILGAPISFIQL